MSASVETFTDHPNAFVRCASPESRAAALQKHGVHWLIALAPALRKTCWFLRSSMMLQDIAARYLTA
jgi:hypothetical protein